MGGNWFKKLFGNGKGGNGVPANGRNRPNKVRPNPKTKPKDKVKEDLSIWGQIMAWFGFGWLAIRPTKTYATTLVEIDSEYCAHKSNFSAWLPCCMTVGLCLLIESPYPFTRDMRRFVNWKQEKDMASLLIPVLTLPAAILLAQFFGCFWNYVSLMIPDGRKMVRCTHTWGRLVDCGLVIIVYRGLLNFLKLWEVVDEKLAFGCFRKDQCAVEGSICHAITSFVSYLHILFGDAMDMCPDGKSKKLGHLLLNFVLLLIILSSFFTYRLCCELKTLRISKAPFRVTFTKGKSTKTKEGFPNGIGPGVGDGPTTKLDDLKPENIDATMEIPDQVSMKSSDSSAEPVVSVVRASTSLNKERRGSKARKHK